MTTKYYLQEQTSQGWEDIKMGSWLTKDGYENLSELVNDMSGAIADDEVDGFSTLRIDIREDVKPVDTKKVYVLQTKENGKWIDVSVGTDPQYDSISQLVNQALGAVENDDLDGYESFQVIEREMNIIQEKVI